MENSRKRKDDRQIELRPDSDSNSNSNSTLGSVPGSAFLRVMSGR